MDGPRAPQSVEFENLVEFLDEHLRSGLEWSIADEYPTTVTKQNLQNFRIITENGKIISHAVLKPTLVKTLRGVIKVACVGSVVTAEEHRNQGLSQSILNDCLKSATDQGCDIALLWTDLYDFYRKLGFELAGSEVSLVIDRPLTVDEKTSPSKFKIIEGTKVDPQALLRLYNQHTVGSMRTADDFAQYLKIPNSRLYTAWNPETSKMEGYIVEGKGADLQGYVHEWGGGVDALVALTNHVQAKLKTPITFIAPQHSENLAKQFVARGAENNATEIEAAKTEALGEVKVDDLYRTGDSGTLQIFDKLMGSTSVRQTRQYQVTNIDNDNVNYSLYVVETGTTYVGKIPRHNANQSASAVTALNSGLKKLKNLFVKYFIDPIKDVLPDGAVRLLAKISVEPSTAVGDDFVSKTASEVMVEQSLATAGSDGGDPQIQTPGSAPSVSNMPEPAQAAVATGPQASPHYFGMHITHHRVMTANCAQIADCKVNATRIEYNEMHPEEGGGTSRWHWILEISKEVPGFFSFLETCASRLVNHNGTNYPVTSCARVNDFRYGSH